MPIAGSVRSEWSTSVRGGWFPCKWRWKYARASRADHIPVHLFHVVPGGLPHLDIGIDSIKLATGIQIIMQSQQAGRFTRLTRSMKYKIFPLINQRFQLFQSDTRQQIDIIVDIRLNWTCRIEKLRYSYPTSAFRCNSLGKIQKFIHFTTGTNRFYPHQ